MDTRTSAGSQLSERGVAALLLLFAMSAFSVLGVAALTTALGSAPEGQTFSIFRSVPQELLTQYVADMVVPNDWRVEGDSGSYQFQLPVLVPENGGDDTGAPAAWHPIGEVPTLAICCESRPGVCRSRGQGSDEPEIVDWTPGADDALWLAFELSSRPDPANADSSIVTARVSPATSVDGASVTCQLEFDGAVIAKGTAQLEQTPAGGSGRAQVGGTMRFAVRTK